MILDDVLTDLLEAMAIDPDKDEWNEWARKLLLAAGDQADCSAAATPPPAAGEDEADWGRPRKPR